MPGGSVLSTQKGKHKEAGLERWLVERGVRSFGWIPSTHAKACGAVYVSNPVLGGRGG